MNGRGKSDRPIVPTKPSNKGGTPAAPPAEGVEGRGLPKGNPSGQNRSRAQIRHDLQSALGRVRQAAVRDKGVQFTTLWHHVYDVDRLREAYLGLKRNAAPGVDRVTWQTYGEDLESNLRDLSDRLKRGAYRAKPVKRTFIPEEDGRQRPLGETSLEDKIVQRATVEVLAAVHETDFIGFSYGFRPGRSQHNALDAVAVAIQQRKVNWVLDIDLDLKSYFDTVRHDLMLSKLAKRIRDRDLLWLCKGILKSGEKRGLPQGSVIGPLWANVFLNDVDGMLERAQRATKQGPYETVRYTRFADDLVVLINSHPRARHWAVAVERRLREELAKLDLAVNEDKTRVVDFSTGVPVDFLGYTFRWVPTRKNPRKKMALCRPQKKKRTRFLRELSHTLRRYLHVPVQEVVREVVNPRMRGWVNYFRWGHSSQDLKFVRWQVDTKVRRFASRQRPKRRGGCRWTTWSRQEIYNDWGLFQDYRVSWCSVPRG